MSIDFFVDNDSSFKKAMYLVKNALKEKGDLTLVSNVFGSLNLTRLAANLERLNYVTIANIETRTAVAESKRKISLRITVKKTKTFDSLFEENERKRNEYIEERNKVNNQAPSGK